MDEENVHSSGKKLTSVQFGNVGQTKPLFECLTHAPITICPMRAMSTIAACVRSDFEFSKTTLSS